MIRLAILSAVALLVLIGCERDKDVPAERPRQTTTTPVAPTTPEAPAASIDPSQVSFPAREEVSLDMGQQVYKDNCASCHEQGVGGAPPRTDREYWQPMVEKGYDFMVTSAIVGYQGEKGTMPPKGGNPDLTNEQVAAAVAYMMEMKE